MSNRECGNAFFKVRSECRQAFEKLAQTYLEKVFSKEELAFLERWEKATREEKRKLWYENPALTNRWRPNRVRKKSLRRFIPASRSKASKMAASESEGMGGPGDESVGTQKVPKVPRGKPLAVNVQDMAWHFEGVYGGQRTDEKEFSR